jgi:hypothetical protein
MKKQTAVEWLVEQLECFGNKHELQLSWATVDELVQQAKAMERQQVEEAWDKRCSHGVVSQTWHIETKNGEQYYQETYGGDK